MGWKWFDWIVSTADFFATTTAVFRNQREIFRSTHDLEILQVLSGWEIVACGDQMTKRGRNRRLDMRMFD